MEEKKWHDHLTAVGTVIALILGGVTFYYQFLRKTQDLQAVVLPVAWDGSPTVTVRVTIWNDGTRDEVVEVGELVISGAKRKKTKRLFGPEVIKPGEAKAFSVTAEVGDLAWYTGREPPEPTQRVLVEEYGVNLEIVLKTMDRAGGVIVSRVWGGLGIQGSNQVSMGTWGNSSTRLNLLTGKAVGQVDLKIDESMPTPVDGT